MADVPQVTIVDGIPTGGTGTVETNSQVIAAVAALGVKLDTTITALQIIDNMVLAAGTANIGDVDVLTINGVAPAFGSGAVGATVQRMVLATDSPGVIPFGSAAMAAAIPMTLATDDTQFAKLLAASRPRIVQLVPSVDATACAQFDVWAATEVVAGAAAAADIPVGVRSVSARRLDSATGLNFRIWFLKANSSVGAENAAFAPADADADDLAGYIDFAVADFVGTTGMVNCFAKKEPSVELWVTPATGTTSIYIAIQVLDAAGIDVGAATDLVLEFQFI